MLVLQIWRWLNGYVKVECKGGFTERFINLCASRGIVLWDIKCSSGILKAKVFQRQQHLLDEISRIAQTDMELSEPIGLPQVLKRNKDRIGLAVGLCLFFIIIKVLTLFVWDIQFQGLSTLNAAEVTQKLESVGIHRGMLISSIDQGASKRVAMKQIPEIAWVSFNIEGSTLYVEISESIKTPDIIPKDTPCNVKAKYSGQILRIGTKAGTPECNVGDAVVEGQILISGISENEEKIPSIGHADGSVIASTQHKVEFSIPLNTSLYFASGEAQLRSKLEVFGFGTTYRYSPTPTSYYSKRVEHYSLFTEKNKVPIDITNEYLQNYIQTDIKYTSKQLDEISSAVIELKKLFLLNDKTINNCNVTKKEVNGNIEYTVVFDCVEDIGYKDGIMFTQ